MAKSRLYRILSRFTDVKPGEEAIAVLLFCYFFLITAPHSIIKPLRTAVYLEDLGALKLPIAYLLTAITMGFVVALHSKLQAKVPRQVLLISSLTFFVSNCLLFWWLFPRGWNWFPLVFWIWANIFIYVLMTQFWISINDVLNPREAKRLIGFFGSGGILGGIIGGLLTGIFARVVAPFHLLLVALCMLILSAFVVWKIYKLQGKKQEILEEKKERESEKTEKRPEKVGFKVCFDTVRKNSYLKLLAGVVTLTIVVSTLIDFQFNKVIEDNPSVRGNLTSFLGFFQAGSFPFFFSFS
jgi:AAA family ATP:ADP antiporter